MLGAEDGRTGVVGVGAEYLDVFISPGAARRFVVVQFRIVLEGDRNREKDVQRLFQLTRRVYFGTVLEVGFSLSVSVVLSCTSHGCVCSGREC